MSFDRELLNNVCTSLRSEERGHRQIGLKKLLKYCESSELNAENCLDIFDLIYLHILKCYADESEKCRSLATEVVSRILEKLPRNDFYLNYIVPAIARRIGRPETVEQSEEMRLQWLEQIRDIVERYQTTEEDSTDYLLKVYNDLIDILKKTLADPFPAAQRESCEIVKLLSKATPSFHFQAEALVKPLLLMLKHKQSANRTVAIETLGIVSLHITTNTECVLNVLTELRLLLLDGVASVRRECGRVGGRLMLELRDRYSHFDKILPLVLCCLDDETQDVSTEIRVLWHRCGEKYYEENEQELSKLELADDRVPLNYPPDLTRPSIGCRAICQRSLKLIDRALNDMEEWQEAVRLHATKLLAQLLIHCEKTVGPLLMEIIPVLASKCNDEDRQVAKEALKASKLLGILIDFNNWKGHALESLIKWRNLGNLKCLTALFASSAQDCKWQGVDEILAAVVEVELYYMADGEFQEHLLYLMDMLLKGYKEHQEEKSTVAVQYKFYRIIMTILSFCGPEEEIQSRAEELLQNMITFNPILHEDHLPTILSGLDFLEDGSDESILFLHGLIVYGGMRVAYLTPLKEAIKKVLHDSDNSEGKVKLLSGLAIAMRKWMETIGEEFSTSQLVEEFVEECLLKCIIWKAGTSSEAIRSIATVVLYALSESDKKSARVVIPKYVKYLIGLMEDQSVATRQYSTRIMTLVGPMDGQNLRLASQALLSRLNDPNREVRESSIKALALLELKAEGTSNDDAAFWSQQVKEVFKGISLHLHDSDEKARTLLLDTLKVLSKSHPAEFQKVFTDQTDPPPCNDAINELMDSLGVLKI